MPAHPQHSNPATAPSSTGAPAVTWGYPFPDTAGKEITDSQTLYRALAVMDDGFFPHGVNGFPHGGVHFGSTAARLDLAGGVRCIADGEIVAYKIDRDYAHLQFTDGKWASYSTGFVLVRHRLTLPPAPNNKGPQPADDTHDIYSLYMHMADWSAYLADDTLARPWWWNGFKAYRAGGKDHQSAPADGGTPGVAGVFVWTEPKAGNTGPYMAGEHVGFMPEGSELTVGEKRGDWGHIKAITAGGMFSPVNGEAFGSDDVNAPWEARNNGRTDSPVTPKGDWGWVFLPDLKPVDEPDPVGTVVICEPPKWVKAGTLLGQIGEYQDYERATPLPPTSRRKLLHLEVFADDGFSGFLTRSRARADQLPADQRTLLVMSAGAKLVPNIAQADRKLGQFRPVVTVTPTPDSPPAGPWAKVQPFCAGWTAGLMMPEGPPVWIERDKLAKPVDGTPAWSRFPLSLEGAADPANGFPLIYSRRELDALHARNKAVDDQNVHWWQVKYGSADGKEVTGWVCEKSRPGTQWQSPWAWPGFEIVDATGIELADAFRRNLVITDAADWREKKEFEPSVAAVNNSALLLKLEETVAKQKPGDSGGKVTAKAMQAAMRLPWLAQALSHVILRYESEWGGDMTRWNAITPLMRNAKDNWLRELERVGKLQWWNEVKDKVASFPGSATVLHIHPIALIGNFASVCHKVCRVEVVEFQTTEGTFRVSKEAFEFVLSKEGYANRPYVPPGDQSSGITVGYGYDLGQQTQATISTELNGIFSPAQITRLQGASGRHGDSARQLQPSLADIRISRDMALQLAIVMKRRYAQYTVNAFPGAARLHPHCQGALLSLVINRGSGMVDRPYQKTRAHMREIRNHIVFDNLSAVPTHWRNMKSLWSDSKQSGLVARREDEAILFEKGMTCNCWR